MEGRGSEGGQLTSTNPAKPVGTLALRNFTIPRKKRASGQVLLEPCPEESRDYSLIQSKLKEARLDMRKEHANAWLWKDVKLVHNEEFLKEFSEKRSEMRTKGRHGREMEERYCFLVASHETTSQIYHHGIRTGTQQQYSLGKPSHGVYLFKHIDVALKHTATGSLTGKTLIVFKVLFGKVKKVTPTLDWNKTPDPMVAFDCHMSKDLVSHRENLSQQVSGSSVFLFDYNDNQELNSRPRQCLPYAVVSFVPAVNATAPTCISPPVSPVKHPTTLTHAPLEHLRGCTVAERRGKGEKATVTFKHFFTPTQTSCPGPEYTYPAPGTETTTTPVQQYDQQNPLLFFPQQLYTPLLQTAGYFSPLLSSVESNIPFQKSPNLSAFPTNGQLLSTTSICRSNTNNDGVIPQTSTEKISTVVYSSRLVKDPRLSRQGSNPEQKTSSLETNNLRRHSHSQDDEVSSGAISCDKNSLGTGEQQCKDYQFKPSQEPKTNPQSKTENMPSMKLFKMKFQKYAAYLKMTAEERQKHIGSQQGMTPEQKQSLIDRVHYYETYYQKYRLGLLFHKNTENEENASILCNMEPKNDKPCLNEMPQIMQDTIQNRSSIRHPEGSDVSTDRGNTEIPTIDLVKDSNQVGHEGSEQKEKEKKDQGSPPDVQGNVVQSAIEESSISLEASFKKREPIESCSENASQQPSCSGSCPSLCPSEQANHVNPPQAVSEGLSQSFTSAANQYTLIITNNTEENSELEFYSIRDTDVEAHCVDVSVLDDVSKNNALPTVTAGGSDQNICQSSTKNTSRGCLNNNQPDDSSKMSIEVRRGELQQDNTIHSALYKRLQLDQLLPDLHGAGNCPCKSYLRPKDLNTTPSINGLCGHLHEMALKEGANKAEMQNCESGEDELTLMTTFQQVSARTKGLTLTERFSKLRNLHDNNTKKQILVPGRTKGAKSDTDHPITGDVKCHFECLHLKRHSNDKQKEFQCDNMKLIQLLAQRFNETRSCSGSKHLQGRCSKVLRRSRLNSTVSISSLNHSAQSNRRALHILKRHIGRRSSTKLATNGTSQGPQSHEKCQDKNPTEEVREACLPAKDHSCQDTPISESKPYQSTEVSSNGDPKKLHGDILQIVDAIEEDPQERGTSNSSIYLHEESFPVTCCESTKDEEIAKAEPGLDTTPQKLSDVSANQVEKDMYNTKEITTNYSACVCEDQSNPVQAVLSIPKNPHLGNLISSYTAKSKTQTAMTLDLPRLVSNMDDTEAKTKRSLYESVVDSSGSDVINSVVDITASESSVEPGQTLQEMDLNLKLISTDLCSLGNLTFARGKEFFGKGQILEFNQGSVQTLKGANNDFVPSSETAIHPAEMRVSTLEQNTNTNSGTINPHLKTCYTNLTNTTVNNAREPAVVEPSNLHSTWQEQENTTAVPSTSIETQLISKLRDYLTKFEITVKKQESVNDSVKDVQEVPMAWITLDSTVHKQQFFDTRHYNRLDLANLQHPEKDCTLNYMLPSVTNSEQATGNVIVINEAATSPITPTKRKTSKHQPKSYTSKRVRRSKLARVSPDSTSMLEPVQHLADLNSHLVVTNDNTDQPQPQITTSVPNLQQQSQNHGKPVHQNQSLSSRTKLNVLSLNGKKDKSPYVQRQYSVTDISITLKLADHAVSVVKLCSLQVKCKSMLRYFISNFERDQKFPFLQSCISRNLILDKYLDHPPEPVDLKFEALNSFLEMQMMVEAYQFVENKINFLSRKATFRSLLWYDPSLYGELYKGAVGFQQQSSLFSSFQKCIATEGCRKLQEYYTAVSTLHQQLQDAPDTSYYMYLKSKRERLEVEAALRNPPDIKSFFLSVPLALMMNLGDTLDDLEKTHRTVMTFVETPSDQLPGVFDVGKAEHLSILCRYIQEKVLFIKSNEQISKVSWFGLEHLLYDASKLLVWRETEHGMSSEVLLQYKRSNPQIVYGVTETGVALVNKIEQHPAYPAERPQIKPEQQVDSARNYRDIHLEISTEKSHSAQGNQTEDSVKEIQQQVRRRATHPPLRSNLKDGGLGPINPVQPNLRTQFGNPIPYPDFPQKSNGVNWRMAGPHAWDWNSPVVEQPSKLNPEIRALLLSKRRMTIPCTDPRTDIQKNSATVTQQQWPPPYIINPRPVERVNRPQPTIGAPHHADLRKEQASEATVPLIKPTPLPCLPSDTSSAMPLSYPYLSFPNTSNQLPPHEIPMPINYPYFLFNEKPYSPVTPSVPLPRPVLHNETQYHHPHPV